MKSAETLLQEAEEEKEEKSKTLEEYFAEKKGTNYRKEARKAEEIKKTNIEKGAEKSKISTLESTLRNQDIYNAGTAKAEGNTLLGF